MDEYACPAVIDRPTGNLTEESALATLKEFYADQRSWADCRLIPTARPMSAPANGPSLGSSAFSNSGARLARAWSTSLPTST